MSNEACTSTPPCDRPPVCPFQPERCAREFGSIQATLEALLRHRAEDRKVLDVAIAGYGDRLTSLERWRSRVNGGLVALVGLGGLIAWAADIHSQLGRWLRP